MHRPNPKINCNKKKFENKIQKNIQVIVIKMYLFPYVLLLHPYILVLVFLTIRRPTFQNHKMPVKTTNMPEKKIETCKKLNRN